MLENTKRKNIFHIYARNARNITDFDMSMSPSAFSIVVSVLLWWF